MTRTAEAAVSSLGLALFVCLVWPMAVANIDDMAMIRTFGGDETAIVETLSSMLERSSPDPGVYKYGSLYFQAPFALIKLTGMSTTHQLAFILRLMSLLGGLLCLAGLGFFGRALFGGGAGISALGLSCALPLMIRWGKTIHPDTLGLAGLIVAWGLILLALHKNRMGLLLAGALVAGIAAGIKLNSVFIIPFLPLAILGLALRNTKGAGAEKWTRPKYALGSLTVVCLGMISVGLVTTLLATPERLAKAAELVALETGGTDALPFWVNALPSLGWGLVIGAGILLGAAFLAWRANLFGRWPNLAILTSSTTVAGLLFCLGFALANMAAFFNPGPVAAWFLNETVRLKHSYVPEGLFFFNTVVAVGFWGWLSTILSGIGLGFLTIRPRGQADRWIGVLLAGWIILNLLYLTASIDAPKPRHAFQILPGLIWLAGAGLARIGALLGRFLPRPWLGLALAGLLILPGLRHGIAYGLQLQKDVAAYGQSPAVVVGRYLESGFDPKTTILHDPYVYVPGSFADSKETWEPSLGLLESFKPDLIVLNQGFFRRYVSFDNAAGLMRPEQRQLAAEYYRSLLKDGLSGGYRPIKRFDRITVYVRVGFRDDLPTLEKQDAGQD